jgi:hypothetical protein
VSALDSLLARQTSPKELVVHLLDPDDNQTSVAAIGHREGSPNHFSALAHSTRRVRWAWAIR